MGRVCFAVLPLVALGLWACGPTHDAPVPADDPRFDPQLLALDAATPSTRFDGAGGSLLTGAGWAPPELEVPAAGDPFSFAWAIDGHSTLWVERPVGDGPWDLWGHCYPHTFDGAPPQTVILKTNHGDTAPTATFEGSGWQEWRLPLPPETFSTPGMVELRLDFAHTERPVDVTPANPDGRRLAMACRTLAVVPRGLVAVDAALTGPSLAPTAGHPGSTRLELTPGTAAAFPLPMASNGTFRLGRVASRCGDCRLRLDRRHGGVDEILWTGPATDATDLQLPLSTPDHGFARLVIHWLDGPSSDIPDGDARDGDARDAATVGLPTDFLDFTRRPVPADPAAPGRTEAEGRPAVFVYMIDTLRADALDPARGVAPEIQRFAADAVTFTRAWSASSWTLPSVVSLFTGVYAESHGVIRGSMQFSGSIPTLAARLADAGYDTVGISQSLIASPELGLDAGFERFYFSNQLNGRALRSQDVRRILYSHGASGDAHPRPLFAYLHTVDPHAPYAPEGADRWLAEQHPGSLPADQYHPQRFLGSHHGDDPTEVAHLEALYLGEVRHADREFGRFVDMLQFLNLYDSSLIILLSDHGEEFGEHGGFDHGRTVFEEMLRVPLVVKFPGGHWAGTSIDSPVSTVDLVPTVLREAGLDPTALALDGVPLHPQDDPVPGRRLLLAEVNPAPAQGLEAVDYRTLLRGYTKCVESRNGVDQFGRPLPPWQAFDLAEDPGELHPAGPGTPEVESCEDWMHRWSEARQGAARPAEGEAPATDDATLDKLRALGYID